MAFESIRKTIRGDAPGQSCELNYFRIGDQQSGKKVFMQAALHADEQPGILILHHLLPLLKAADEKNLLNAEFVLFPMVNPLGMGNIHFRQHSGRYNWSSGVNFNRQWPDLFDNVRENLEGRLGSIVDENIRIVRSEVGAWLKQLKPVNAMQQQQKLVMNEAYDADFVLDLHCDNEALPHVFISPHLVPEFIDLSDWVGAEATLTCKDSGGGSFDEVWSGLWSNLINHFTDKPLRHACCSATLEYRGNFDVFDDLNRQDALNLYGFFQSRSLIGGEPVTQKPGSSPPPTDLAATEMLRVDQAGLLAYKVKLGERVSKGQIIAELVALEGDQAFVTRTPVYAGTDGVVISRNTSKYVWPGCSIAKIVGSEILESRGNYLLED